MSGPAGALSIHLAGATAPRATAVVDGETVLDFAALSSRVAGAQIELRARGLPVGARVAVKARPDLSGLIGASALLEEGLVPCLLHPRWPKPVQAELARRVGAATTLDLEDLARRPSGVPPAPRPERDPEADLAVFFTSGTSGSPKGVRLSRRAFLAAAAGWAASLGWRPDDRWLLNLPVAHIGGFSILIRTRLARRAVVLPEPGAGSAFDPATFVRSLEARRVTLASLVPTMLARVIETGLEPPPTLRALLLGGAAAPRAVLEAARRLGWPALPTYGLTEACSQVATVRPGTPPTPDPGVGRPLPGVEVRIRAGHIEVRGPTLFSGYVPESPALTEDGWLRTGDLGRLDDRGRLFVEGRASDLVVTGGENVSPVRVEDALRSCPGIQDAAVYGLPDSIWGERVAASVVLRSGARPTRSELEAALRERLAGFERPRTIRVVRVLPLTPSGKLDRRRAREEAEGTPDAELLDRMD